MFTLYGAPPKYGPHVRYAVSQKEKCPTTGREHYQGYVEFTKPLRLAAAQAQLGEEKAHLEPRRGTREQARDYCKKLETRIEDPQEHGTWIQEKGRRTDLEHVLKLAQEGHDPLTIVEEIPSALHYNRAVKDVVYGYKKRKYAAIKYMPVEALVYYGSTGTGKTRKAMEEPSVFKWNPIKGQYWLDGYDGQTTLLIDEYSGQLPIETFLALTDVYPMQVPVKGGFTFREWNKVIVTTNIHPDDWYPALAHKHREALKRRITIIPFSLRCSSGANEVSMPPSIQQDQLALDSATSGNFI